MNESKTDQAVRMARHDSGHLRIRLRIIVMKQREDDSLVDARRTRPPQIRIQRRICVPWGSHAFAFAGVTVEIDDHPAIPTREIASFRWPDSSTFSSFDRAV